MQCCVQEYWSIEFSITKQEIIAMASTSHYVEQLFLKYFLISIN